MALYLVQHGKALSKDKDPEQRLSYEGKAEVALIAETVKKYKVNVSRIEHSTKARARETALIFSEALNLPEGAKERDGIKPMDDVKAVAVELKAEDNHMLVGHLPFMEKLTSYLITGQEEPPVIKFQNGGIVCLDKSPDSVRWHIRWTLMPNIK